MTNPHHDCLIDYVLATVSKKSHKTPNLLGGGSFIIALLIRDTVLMGGISVEQAEAEFDAALQSGKLVRPDFYDKERYVHCDFVNAARLKDEELDAGVAERARSESMYVAPARQS